jgi:hypothetical protein
MKSQKKTSRLSSPCTGGAPPTFSPPLFRFLLHCAHVFASFRYEESMFEEPAGMAELPASGQKKVPSYLLDDGELEGIGGQQKAVAL